MDIITPTAITAAMVTACNIPENDYAAYNGSTCYKTGDRVISTTTHKVYEALQGAYSTVTITIATPGVVSWLSHGLTANKPVQFTTTGALPTGLSTGTTYYVSATGLTADSFSVSATAGGATIATSGTQSGTHTCTVATNIGKDPTLSANTSGTAPYWLVVGSTNKWRLFDGRSSDQSSASNAITATLAPGRFDSIAFVNLDAYSIDLTLTDPIEGVVYTHSEPLQIDNCLSWYDYFFLPIVRRTDVAISDVPPYSNASMAISINYSGGTAKCGEIVLGLGRNLGDSQWGAKAGIVDYSRKDTDTYGNATLVQRKFSKRLSVDVFTDNTYVDETKRLLETLRATPLVWVADDEFSSTIIYGFYRDFSVVLSSPAGSFCSLEIEGLT